MFGLSIVMNRFDAKMAVGRGLPCIEIFVVHHKIRLTSSKGTSNTYYYQVSPEGVSYAKTAEVTNRRETSRKRP